ncbi:EAL domain-containing protein [Novosphingobium mangrovi (ex Huang et al. 2023)]|uniref:EAL domain-containing protein n=1 Tax=Novosphingobium mangrovi (ex Huang et al. 2023) TaxID=2976432 RepID=A0ABT2I2M1_9SPHN|nr:EAL domain-containing protein [Novosphingobium mangrovi (ex Huang et al. 2023)]MCT2399054.1 EAL domain-containing protein [Novosphingobium mangrovi (ex Huang et al. 2023)]
MSVKRGIAELSRRHQLLVPIAGMTFGTLALLVLLATFLIVSFDWTASNREQQMVEQGFQRQLEQYDEILVPQADWDAAVTNLDHKFNEQFADVNFSAQLYMFNGFTRSFFVDGDGKLLYASVDGKKADKTAFAPFAGTISKLLAPIRKAEARRPPIRPSTTSGDTVTQPIQANGIVRVGSTVYIVIATLIQPDLGKVLPKGPRAPVVIMAMPVDRSVLNTLATRYLVDDLELVDASSSNGIGKAYFPLLDPTGREIAALVWAPRRPGAMLFQDLKLPMLAALVLLIFAGWVLIRRSGAIVDELILNEKQAKHLAYHDQLTRVPNRSLLFERLPVMLGEVGRTTPMLAILCVDLDRFKEVNDTLGHPAGDQLLKLLAERLQAASAQTENALIARLGGDEFVLVCPVQDRQAAEALANRCLDLILQPMDCEYGQIDVGCSVGVALIDDGKVDPSIVLRRADMALYQSKADGKGRVTFFEPGMDEAFQTRRGIEESLRASLRDDTFHVVYQPQVDVEGNVPAVEALLRWKHPELGEISPSVFIPLAEECGLIMPIGEFVMRRVFEETGRWCNLRVAINVSAVQMRTPGYATQVMQLAARTGIDPSRYEIELTETALLGDGPATAENFEILRRLGFSIVLDDFGTGYSSLSLLHRFHVDKIKIDRTFVHGLGESGEVNALVTAIVKLAKSFNLGVIAEGVETEEQLRELTLAGYSMFQGFLTGMPQPAGEIAARYEPAATMRLQA